MVQLIIASALIAYLIYKTILDFEYFYMLIPVTFISIIFIGATSVYTPDEIIESNTEMSSYDIFEKNDKLYALIEANDETLRVDDIIFTNK